MRQLTLRVDDSLISDLKAEAARQKKSVNALATDVFRALVDPGSCTDETEELRARLDRAGLLAKFERRPIKRPSREAIAKARKAAANGRPLSDLIAEGRR